MNSTIPELQEILSEMKDEVLRKVMQPLEMSKKLVEKITKTDLEHNLLRFEGICTYLLICADQRMNFKEDSYLSKTPFWTNLMSSLSTEVNSYQQIIISFCDYQEDEYELNIKPNIILNKLNDSSSEESFFDISEIEGDENIDIDNSKQPQQTRSR